VVSDIGKLVAVRGRVLVCVLKRQGIDTGAVQKDGAKNQASEYLRAMSSSIAIQSLVLAEGKAGGRRHHNQLRGGLDATGGSAQRKRHLDTASAATKEQWVTKKDNDQTSDEVPAETTSVFHPHFLNEPDATAAEGAISGIEGLPTGSALLVVTRGPNAGSRFPLDQPVASAGRHPDSDIYLDDVTVSRRHAEFRLQNDQCQVVDVGSLNGTYVNRKPVDSAVLATGDEVQIGKYRLVFLTGPTTTDSEPARPSGRGA